MTIEEDRAIALKAIELAAELIPYVDTYFLEKWGYCDDLKSLRAQVKDW